VRKKPGLTMVVVMPNGATSCWQRLHPALEANFDTAYAEQNAKPTSPAVDEIEIMLPRALLPHDRQDGAGDIHRADEERPQLQVYLLRRQLLEVAGKEVAGIVDQHVDAAEPVDSGPHGRLGIGAAGHVQS